MEQKPFNRSDQFQIPPGVDAKLIAAELLEMLDDATERLGDFIGTDCECDNTHEANNTVCCLCQYNDVMARAKGKVFVNPY